MKNISRKILLIFIIIIFPLLIFSLYEYHLKTFWANLKRNQAEFFLSRGNYQKGFQKFEEGLEVNDPAVNFYLRYRYGQVATNLAWGNKYFYRKQNVEILKRGLELMEENIKTTPYFTRNYTTAGVLANYLFETGEKKYKEMADQYFARAVELSPNRASILLKWVRTDFIARDFQKAEEKLKRALDINPNYGQVYWTMGLLRIYQKKYDQAEEQFKKAASLGYNIHPKTSLTELGYLYHEIGDYQNSIGTYEKIYEEMRRPSSKYRYRIMIDRIKARLNP